MTSMTGDSMRREVRITLAPIASESGRFFAAIAGAIGFTDGRFREGLLLDGLQLGAPNFALPRRARA